MSQPIWLVPTPRACSRCNTARCLFCRLPHLGAGPPSTPFSISSASASTRSGVTCTHTTRRGSRMCAVLQALIIAGPSLWDILCPSRGGAAVRPDAALLLGHAPGLMPPLPTASLLSPLPATLTRHPPPHPPTHLLLRQLVERLLKVGHRQHGPHHEHLRQAQQPQRACYQLPPQRFWGCICLASVTPRSPTPGLELLVLLVVPHLLGGPQRPGA